MPTANLVFAILAVIEVLLLQKSECEMQLQRLPKGREKECWGSFDAGRCVSLPLLRVLSLDEEVAAKTVRVG
jgi:hypothetical protein